MSLEAGAGQGADLELSAVLDEQHVMLVGVGLLAAGAGVFVGAQPDPGERSLGGLGAGFGQPDAGGGSHGFARVEAVFVVGAFEAEGLDRMAGDVFQGACVGAVGDRTSPASQRWMIRLVQLLGSPARSPAWRIARASSSWDRCSRCRACRRAVLGVLMLSGWAWRA